MLSGETLAVTFAVDKALPKSAGTVGTEEVTLCPMLPGETLAVTFVVDKALPKSVAATQVRRYRWEVSPDGFERLVEVVNGRTSSGTIREEQASTVVVEIWNPWTDGTEEVTLCPMLPGETLAVTFVVDKSAAASRLRRYRWEVSPDSFVRLVEVVNGRTSGGTIREQQGSTIIVEIWNPGSYGTEEVTLFPMLPGETLAVTFVVNKALSKSAAATRVRRSWWEVSPDGFERLVKVVNERTSGGTIREQQGSTVIIEIGSIGIDGTNVATRWSILPGEDFVYQLVVDRYGIYLYHSFYDIQWSASLYGSIQSTLVEGMAKPFFYNHDYIIILKDRWHKSIIEQSPGISMHFDWIKEQQTLLHKGRGKFNHARLTMDVCNAANEECSPYLHGMAGRTYLLHVSSITSLSALNFEIEGHNMTIVEIDGHYVLPYVVKNLNIYYGDTYSILVTMNQEPTEDYWISTYVISQQHNTKIYLGILYYYPIMMPRTLPIIMEPIIPYWNNITNCITHHQRVQVVERNNIMMPLIPDCITTSFNTQDEIGKNMSVHLYVWVGIVLAVIMGWIFIPLLVLVLWRYEGIPREIGDVVDYGTHVPYTVQPIVIIFLFFMIIYTMILWM